MWDAEPGPELGVFCNLGSCEKGSKDLQELNNCRTIKSLNSRDLVHSCHNPWNRIVFS